MVLDKSGSMNSLREEAVNGCNETLRTIRESNVTTDSGSLEQFVTLVLFNTSRIEYIYQNTPVQDVSDLTLNKYRPSGGTPLYDTLGDALTKLQKQVGDECDYNVLVTIITDGQENASHEYSYLAIKNLIISLKDEGWVFTYIGADHDVEQVAFELNIESSLRFDKSKEGMEQMWTHSKMARDNYYREVMILSSIKDEKDRKKQMKELGSNFFDE